MSDLLKVRVGGSSYLCRWEKEYSVKIGDRRYPAVKIGNQLWMAENLDNDITEYTYHYLNYGAYYTVSEINTGIGQLLQSCGVTGWHVPTMDEMNTMIDYVAAQEGTTRAYAGKYLLSTSETGSVDDRYGLSLLLNGSYDGRDEYKQVTDAGIYVNLGERSDDNTYINRMYLNGYGYYGNGREYTYRKYGVRLVRTLT